MLSKRALIKEHKKTHQFLHLLDVSSLLENRRSLIEDRRSLRDHFHQQTGQIDNFCCRDALNTNHQQYEQFCIFAI
jgi:hypothetical protein